MGSIYGIQFRPPTTSPTRAEFELLALACAALDRVQSLAEQIAIDGEVIRDGEHPPKAHPALRDELAGRAFVARTLERLGVTAVAPTAPAGLPGKSWRGF